MEMTTVIGTGTDRFRRHGAALPAFGTALPARRRSADTAFGGGRRGTASEPTPAPTLDVTSAGTS